MTRAKRTEHDSRTAKLMREPNRHARHALISKGNLFPRARDHLGQQRPRVDPWRRPKGSRSLGTRLIEGKFSSSLFSRAFIAIQHFRVLCFCTFLFAPYHQLEIHDRNHNTRARRIETHVRHFNVKKREIVTIRGQSLPFTDRTKIFSNKTLACVASVSVGFSVRRNSFRLFGCAKVGASKIFVCFRSTFRAEKPTKTLAMQANKNLDRTFWVVRYGVLFADWERARLKVWL